MSLWLQDKEGFANVYRSVLLIVNEVEQFLAAYLHAIFSKKMKTHEALDLLTRYCW